MLESINFKNPILYLFVGVVFLIFFLSRRAASEDTSASQSNESDVNARAEYNLQMAQIGAESETQRQQNVLDTLKATLDNTLQLTGLSAQKDVKLAELDYGYDAQIRKLENDRVLGLTSEDTKRYNAQLESTTALSLGLSKIQSDEKVSGWNNDLMREKISSDERIADFTSTRALSYADIEGRYQVQAIKAAKPSGWTSFLQGLGGGVGSLLGFL